MSRRPGSGSTTTWLFDGAGLRPTRGHAQLLGVDDTAPVLRFEVLAPIAYLGRVAILDLPTVGEPSRVAAYASHRRRWR